MASEFVIEGLKELRAMADGYAGARGLMRDLLVRISQKFVGQSLATSKQKFLSGGSPDVLKVRSGRLRSRITPEVKESGNQILISLGTGVPYGPIHEYGGAIFRKGKKVGQMPERSFLRRAFEMNIDPFVEDIFTAIQGAAEGGWKRG